MTTTTTIPYTNARATETLHPDALKLSSPETDAFGYSLGIDQQSRNSVPDTSVPVCSSICSALNPFRNDQGGRVQGFLGHCLGFRVEGNGNCTMLLQKSFGAGYLGPNCAVDGFQRGTLSVNAAKFPFAVGGQGQCASAFTTIAT